MNPTEKFKISTPRLDRAKYTSKLFNTQPRELGSLTSLPCAFARVFSFLESLTEPLRDSPAVKLSRRRLEALKMSRDRSRREF